MIEIRNCSKAFGEIHAIDHVSMEIGERQIFGLVGTNEMCIRDRFFCNIFSYCLLVISCKACY